MCGSLGQFTGRKREGGREGGRMEGEKKMLIRCDNGQTPSCPSALLFIPLVSLEKSSLPSFPSFADSLTFQWAAEEEDPANRMKR